MQMNRTTAVALGLVAVCAAGLTAQTQETKTTTKTKVEIKDGRNVTVTGCLERRENGDYFLTDVREKGRTDPSQYALVTNDDLSKHVGERVEVKGQAVANGNGRVKIESKTKTEVENGKDLESKSKTEGTSGALDMPLLGLKSIKTVASSCHS
jgi:hypothetical protein